MTCKAADLTFLAHPQEAKEYLAETDRTMVCLQDFVSFAAIRGYQPTLCGKTLKSVRYSGRPEVDGLLYHGRKHSMANMVSSYDTNCFDNVNVTP